MGGRRARRGIQVWADGTDDGQADGIARTLLDAEASQADRVGQYLRNSPEYLEVSHAALKAGIPAVNSNYRYKGEELRYLWDDADVSYKAPKHIAFVELIPRGPNGKPDYPAARILAETARPGASAASPGAASA